MDIQIKHSGAEFFKYQPIKDRDYSSFGDTFLKNTLTALDYLYFNDIMIVTYHKNTPEEKTVDLIDMLIENAPETIYIEKGESNQYLPNTNTVMFNDINGIMFRKDYKDKFSGSNVGYNSPMSLLAHELAHCYHELFDVNGYLLRKSDQSTKGEKVIENGNDLSFPNEEEELVTTLTNQICERLGEDKRGNYGRSYYLTESVISIEKMSGIA